MAYGTFKNLDEVANQFSIEIKTIEFIKELGFSANDFYFQVMVKNLRNKRNFISENSICEAIIFPILNIVSDRLSLPLWSHAKFDVAPEEGLCGIPDFLIAPVSKTGLNFTNPIVCIAEVKKENFDEGWTQALCEMIAAQRFNSNVKKPIYGIATSGEFWKFGKLVEKQLFIDSRAYSATLNLQQVLDVLNWFLEEAKKTLDNPA